MRQPLLVSLARRLEATGLITLAVELSPKGSRPSPPYAAELAALRTARDELGPLAVLERLAGGRPAHRHRRHPRRRT